MDIALIISPNVSVLKPTLTVIPVRRAFCMFRLLSKQNPFVIHIPMRPVRNRAYPWVDFPFETFNVFSSFFIFFSFYWITSVSFKLRKGFRFLMADMDLRAIDAELLLKPLCKVIALVELSFIRQSVSSSKMDVEFYKDPIFFLLLLPSHCFLFADWFQGCLGHDSLNKLFCPISEFIARNFPFSLRLLFFSEIQLLTVICRSPSATKLL